MRAGVVPDSGSAAHADRSVQLLRAILLTNVQRVARPAHKPIRDIGAFFGACIRLKPLTVEFLGHACRTIDPPLVPPTKAAVSFERRSDH